MALQKTTDSWAPFVWQGPPFTEFRTPLKVEARFSDRLRKIVAFEAIVADAG